MKQNLLLSPIFFGLFFLLGLLMPIAMNGQHAEPKYYHRDEFPVPDSSTRVAKGIREIRYFPLVKSIYDRVRATRTAENGTFHLHRNYDDYGTYAIAKFNPAGQLILFHYYSRTTKGYAYEYDYDSLGRRIQYREYDFHPENYPVISRDSMTVPGEILQASAERLYRINYHYGADGQLQSIVFPQIQAPYDGYGMRYGNYSDSIVTTLDADGRLVEGRYHRKFVDSHIRAEKEWEEKRDVYHYDAAGRLSHIDMLEDDT
ncbi:MAG: hypothetical protein AAF570_05850, partial [Bacteroidota bacterium]